MENEAIQMACVENSSENVVCRYKQRITGSLNGRGEEEITKKIPKEAEGRGPFNLYFTLI